PSELDRRGRTRRVSADGERVRLGVRELDALALDELLEGADAARAELAPRLLLEHAQGVLVVACGPVDPVGQHRVEGVGDGDDAGAERDVLAGQLVRVAPAVAALLVLAAPRP